jgi:hypothetical protein
MAELDARALLEEFYRRSLLQDSAREVVAGIRKELFDKQLAFWDDPSVNKAALCTRRAGKTSMWARYCTATALLNPRGLIRIWGINRLRTKQLLWAEFLDVARRHKINVKAHETELSLTFDNGASIRFLGADKDKEAQKKRGDKTILEVVLEAQLFGSYLQTLVEEVVEPCTFDLGGTICLEGTPGPICGGYWYDVTGREDSASRWTSDGGKHQDENGEEKTTGAGWSCHRWSVLDNPFLPKARAELVKLKKKRNWKDDSPTYVREWLGKWVNDFGTLYYRFDPTRNTYNPDEIQPWGPGWMHVLGWDLGARDDMALVVWGWHPHVEGLYEAFSWKKPGALSAEIMEQINRLEKQGPAGVPLNIVRRFADTGGGGKMYVNDVAARHKKAFEPAKKSEKWEHVLLMNDDFSSGLIKCRQGSPLAQEYAALQKDPDWPPADSPEKPPREEPSCPNHCADAGLYSYRGAWHYLHTEEDKPPPRGTESWFAKQAQKMEESVLQQARQEQEEADEWLI